MSGKKDTNKWLTINCKVCGVSFESRVSRLRKYCSKKCSANDTELNKTRYSSSKNTCIVKYGGHPMTTETTKQNYKNSILNKYGVEHYSKHTDYVDKVKNTKYQRYGNANYNNSAQAKQTLLKKYGVDSLQKLQSVRTKSTETKKEHQYELLKNVIEQKNIKWLCSSEEYSGHNYNNIYKFSCNKCAIQFDGSVYNLHNIFCKQCNPEKITNVTDEIYAFLIQILEPKDVVVNDTTVLNGKNLDFYVPSKKLAIDINTLYWDSEVAGNIGKYYHINKTKSCTTHGIHLIHIFENEWIYKKDIVKSIIKNLLNVTKDITKYSARECEVEEIDQKTKNAFLNQNHLQGEDKSTIKIGLYSDETLLSVMTFRKSSRFDKTSEWELVRFCNKTDTVIVGGASKLFSYFIKNYSPNNIVTYSDRRYFSGKIYETLGFNFVDYTPVNYYYIVNSYKDLRHRMSFQKHKLKNILINYDEKLSEWANMKLNGYDRIWDCGNSKYFIKLNQTVN